MEQQDQSFQVIIIQKKEHITNLDRIQNFYLEDHPRVIFWVKIEIQTELAWAQAQIWTQTQIEAVQTEEEPQDLIEMNQIEDNQIPIKTEMKLWLPLLIPKIKNKS